jgi:hypothetical protein
VLACFGNATLRFSGVQTLAKVTAAKNASICTSILVRRSLNLPPNIRTMAGDTRDENQSPTRRPPPGATEPPDHVKTPNKVYEVFHSPPQSANALPEGSGQNTAGRRERPPAITDAVKTIRLEDFKKVHMYPCVRESLLMGIGSGFGIGGIRALWGGTFSCASIEEPSLR